MFPAVTIVRDSLHCRFLTHCKQDNVRFHKVLGKDPLTLPKYVGISEKFSLDFQDTHLPKRLLMALNISECAQINMCL